MIYYGIALIIPFLFLRAVYAIQLDDLSKIEDISTRDYYLWYRNIFLYHSINFSGMKFFHLYTGDPIFDVLCYCAIGGMVALASRFEYLNRLLKQ